MDGINEFGDKLAALLRERNALLARAESAERERDEAARLLEELQWSMSNGRYLQCPCCQNFKDKKHAPDCRLSAFLSRLAQPKETKP